MKTLIIVFLFSQISHSPVLEDKLDLSIADDVIQNARNSKEKIEDCLYLMQTTISCKRKNVDLLAKIIRNSEKEIILLKSFQEDADRLSVALLAEIKNRNKNNNITRDESLRSMAKYQELRGITKISLKFYYKKIHEAAREVERLSKQKRMASLGHHPELFLYKNSHILRPFSVVIWCEYAT